MINSYLLQTISFLLNSHLRIKPLNSKTCETDFEISG